MNKGRDIVSGRVKYGLLSTIIGLGLTVAVVQNYMDSRNEPKIERVPEERDYTPEQIEQIEEQSIRVMNDMLQGLEGKVGDTFVPENFVQEVKPYEPKVILAPYDRICECPLFYFHHYNANKRA